MKKILSTVLCVVMMSTTAFAYVPDSSVEVDDSAEVFSYIDDLSSANAQTLTTIGANVVGSNWRMRNESETPAGLQGHEGNSPEAAKFGINSSGYLFVDAVFNSVQGYNASVASSIPALVLKKDLTGLSAEHRIKYEVLKTHNATVSTGVRFMVHNGGNNYYALILGGNNYNEGSGIAGWQLLKSTNGNIMPLVQGGHLDDEGYKKMRNSSGVFWTVEINVVGKEISFKATLSDDSSFTFGASVTDDDMFDVSGNDMGVWLMAMNGNNNPARNAVYKNIRIDSYKPYITAPEPDTLMYIDVTLGKTPDVNGIYSFGTSAIVRKLCVPSLSNSSSDIYLSKDKAQWDKVSSASFDTDGYWLNNKTEEKYSYIAFGADVSGDVSTLAEFSSDSTFLAPLKSTLTLCPQAPGAFGAADFVWSSNREDVATVSGGVVELLRKGDVTITAQYGDTIFEFPISVIGEIEDAINNGTVEEYINSVKPVFTEINRAIGEEDADALKTVFLNTGSVKIGDIVDIDTQKVSDLQESELDSFIARIMTYESFPCVQVEDVYYLADVIDTEYAVGVLNNVTDNATFTTELGLQNYYLKLDLENKYYKQNVKEVAAILNGLTFDNAADLHYEFKQAYVMAGMQKMLSPEMMEVFIKDCKNEIGYDEDNFKKIDSIGLYNAIIEKKSSFVDIEKLKQFVDDYKKSEKPSTPKPELGGGGGGSGGGGSGSAANNTNAFVNSSTVEKIDKETTVTPKQPVAFSDLDSKHWAYNSIITLKNKNIIDGYEDGSFRPEVVVTRAEFIKMVTLALGTEAKGDAPEFTDISKDDWYYKAVISGAGDGIITGYPDGSFRPDAPVSREEMAVMLYRIYLKRSSELKAGNDTIQYKDAESISHWAVEAINALSVNGILSGGVDMMFNPLRGATRAETAKCIAALL